MKSIVEKLLEKREVVTIILYLDFYILQIEAKEKQLSTRNRKCKKPPYPHFFSRSLGYFLLLLELVLPYVSWTIPKIQKNLPTLNVCVWLNHQWLMVKLHLRKQCLGMSCSSLLG